LIRAREALYDGRERYAGAFCGLLTPLALISRAGLAAFRKPGGLEKESSAIDAKKPLDFFRSFGWHRISRHINSVTQYMAQTYTALHP
jgi:hypothetical protein